MHLLHRGVAPRCLAAFRHGAQAWTDVTSDDKTEIWHALDEMQGRRCAYCEADIGNSDKHIEHFRQSSRYIQGTFDWGNLFGSCCRSDSCGKHKDCCGTYNHADIIKPDIDDPERFFIFVSDGTIAIREGLNPNDQHRAAETLRIFNLDARHGPLRRMRQQAAAGYVQTGEYLSELYAEFEEGEWFPLLQAELIATVNLPFATAIKHILQP